MNNGEMEKKKSPSGKKPVQKSPPEKRAGSPEDDFLGDIEKELNGLLVEAGDDAIGDDNGVEPPPVAPLPDGGEFVGVEEAFGSHSPRLRGWRMILNGGFRVDVGYPLFYYQMSTTV